MGIVGSMAHAKTKPSGYCHVQQHFCQIISFRDSNDAQCAAAHAEIQQITTTLGDLNHGVKRNDFRFPGSAQRFRVLCKMAVLVVRHKVLVSGLGLGPVQDPVFPPDFKHWIF